MPKAKAPTTYIQYRTVKILRNVVIILRVVMVSLYAITTATDCTGTYVVT